MKKLFGVVATLLLGASLAVASGTDVRFYQVNSAEKNDVGVSVFIDAESNNANSNARLRNMLVGQPDLRLGTVSASVIYTNAADFTQTSFVLANNVRKIVLWTNDGASTNYCYIGFSASITGSAPTGGTIEAYQHNRKIFGETNTAGRSVIVIDGIQTRGGFSTLYCGCALDSDKGISQIGIEQWRP